MENIEKCKEENLNYASFSQTWKTATDILLNIFSVFVLCISKYKDKHNIYYKVVIIQIFPCIDIHEYL